MVIQPIMFAQDVLFFILEHLLGHVECFEHFLPVQMFSRNKIVFNPTKTIYTRQVIHNEIVMYCEPYSSAFIVSLRNKLERKLYSEHLFAVT